VEAVDVALVLLRMSLGITMIAHGWNHAFGGGGLAGTARWFESIGVRPGRINALAATVTELGAGLLLVLGFLTPLAAAAVVGTLLVALVTNHARNGFFIFRPGEGYEYVLMIIVVATALGGLGAGRWSLDRLIGFDVNGWVGLGVAVVLGGAAGAGTLVLFWRPRELRPAVHGEG
jgi:putative oxidoreductase